MRRTPGDLSTVPEESRRGKKKRTVRGPGSKKKVVRGKKTPGRKSMLSRGRRGSVIDAFGGKKPHVGAAATRRAKASARLAAMRKQSKMSKKDRRAAAQRAVALVALADVVVEVAAEAASAAEVSALAAATAAAAASAAAEIAAAELAASSGEARRAAARLAAVAAAALAAAGAEIIAVAAARATYDAASRIRFAAVEAVLAASAARSAAREAATEAVDSLMAFRARKRAGAALIQMAEGRIFVALAKWKSVIAAMALAESAASAALGAASGATAVALSASAAAACAAEDAELTVVQRRALDALTMMSAQKLHMGFTKWRNQVAEITNAEVESEARKLRLAQRVFSAFATWKENKVRAHEVATAKRDAGTLAEQLTAQQAKTSELERELKERAVAERSVREALRRENEALRDELGNSPGRSTRRRRGSSSSPFTPRGRSGRSSSSRSSTPGRGGGSSSNSNELLDALFHETDDIAHPMLPRAQDLLSREIALRYASNVLSRRASGVVRRTRNEAKGCARAIAEARAQLHAEVDARCDALCGEVDAVVARTREMARAPVDALHALYTEGGDEIQRLCTESLETGDFSTFAVVCESSEDRIDSGERALPVIANAIAHFERSAQIALRDSSWSPAIHEVVQSIHAVGDVDSHGLDSGLTRLFARNVPAVLLKIFQMAAPNVSDSRVARLRWASALAIFDWRLREQMVAVLFDDGDGAVAPCRTMMPITEVVAREWCCLNVDAEHMDPSNRISGSGISASATTGSWKELVARGGDLVRSAGVFASACAESYRLELGGAIVVKTGSFLHSAIASSAMAPDTGVFTWSCIILADEVGAARFTFGVCSELATATTASLGYTAHAVAFGTSPADARSGMRGAFQLGDSVRLELDTRKGTLAAWRNGTRLASRFSGLRGRTLRAYVEIADEGGSVHLLGGVGGLE